MRIAPNKLPTKVKQLKGTYKKAIENRDEPDLGCVPVPDPPEHLGEDIKQVWNRLKPQLDALGIYTEADQESFERLVMASYNCDRVGKEEPRDQKSFLAAMKEVRGWLQDFGMTPAARARVKQLPGKKALTDIDEFFAN